MTTPADTSALFAELYKHLEVLSGKHVREFDGAMTLSAAPVLHEAYLRYANHFPDKARFLAYAARAMRGVVIDVSRARQAQRRGGEFHFTKVTIADVAVPSSDSVDLERLGEALVELEGLNRRLAETVDLHFFCGFTFPEIAEQRGTSERMVMRDWRKARLLLAQVMGEKGGVPGLW